MIEFQGKFDSSASTAINKRTFKKLWWLFVFCSLMLAMVGISLIAFANDFSDIVLGVLTIGFGALFTPSVLLLTKYIQKKQNNSMNILSSDTVQVFQFYPDKLIITQRKGDEYEAQTTAKYSYLYRVEETATTYFLFISKVQSHVVNKADLVQGTLGELNEIFSANLGTRYKQVK